MYIMDDIARGGPWWRGEVGVNELLMVLRDRIEAAGECSRGRDEECMARLHSARSSRRADRVEDEVPSVALPGRRSSIHPGI